MADAMLLLLLLVTRVSIVARPHKVAHTLNAISAPGFRVTRKRVHAYTCAR